LTKISATAVIQTTAIGEIVGDAMAWYKAKEYPIISEVYPNIKYCFTMTLNATLYLLLPSTTFLIRNRKVYLFVFFPGCLFLKIVPVLEDQRGSPPCRDL
jgi:hypothetical protein